MVTALVTLLLLFFFSCLFFLFVLFSCVCVSHATPQTLGFARAASMDVLIAPVIYDYSKESGPLKFVACTALVNSKLTGLGVIENYPIDAWFRSDNSVPGISDNGDNDDNCNNWSTEFQFERVAVINIGDAVDVGHKETESRDIQQKFQITHFRMCLDCLDVINVMNCNVIRCIYCCYSTFFCMTDLRLIGCQ